MAQKKLRLSIDTQVIFIIWKKSFLYLFILSIQARHLYICDSHKAKIQSARTKKRRKDSEDDSNETDTTDYPDVRSQNWNHFILANFLFFIRWICTPCR